MPPHGPGISGRFQKIIDGLCRALGVYSDRERSAMALVDIIFHALRRRAKRFAALVARIEAGLRPPPPRHRKVAADGAVYERVRPMPDLVPPSGRVWLLKMLEHECTHLLDPLRNLVIEPEMAALIAADPRVARVLRPLWFMLNPRPLPAVLEPPPRPPGPPRPRARVVRMVRPSPPPAPPAPPVPRVARVPYIPGFGPAPLPT